MKKCLTEISGKLASFTPQNLANAAWGLAKLGHRPPQQWLSEFQEASYSKLREFSAHELACTLWGLATLNCKADMVSKMLSAQVGVYISS